VCGSVCLFVNFFCKDCIRPVLSNFEGRATVPLKSINNLLPMYPYIVHSVCVPCPNVGQIWSPDWRGLPAAPEETRDSVLHRRRRWRSWRLPRRRWPRRAAATGECTRRSRWWRGAAVQWQGWRSTEATWRVRPLRMRIEIGLLRRQSPRLVFFLFRFDRKCLCSYFEGWVTSQSFKAIISRVGNLSHSQVLKSRSRVVASVIVLHEYLFPPYWGVSSSADALGIRRRALLLRRTGSTIFDV
jgi:hypothetical protein